MTINNEVRAEASYSGGTWPACDWGVIGLQYVTNSNRVHIRRTVVRREWTECTEAWQCGERQERNDHESHLDWSEQVGKGLVGGKGRKHKPSSTLERKVLQLNVFGRSISHKSQAHSRA